MTNFVRDLLDALLLTFWAAVAAMAIVEYHRLP